MMLTTDPAAMPRHTILVLNATCVGINAQKREISSGTVRHTLTMKTSTSAQSKTANSVSMGGVEAFEGSDRIMLNDTSRDNTQDKMCTYYKEPNLK
jgi:hypothetical protein